MKTIECRDWVFFLEELDVVRNTLPGPHASELLFRGQGNSEFTLQSTLERVSQKPRSFLDYFRLINRIRTRVETLLEKKWNLPTFQNVKELTSEFDQYGSRLVFPETDMYGYMIYLRHHGFPSPLLDWSSSEFVAAFFAFWHALRSREVEKKVSIYAYCEMPKGMKSYDSDEAGLHLLGPYVATHHRHFRQQSCYTMAVKFGLTQDTQERMWLLATHEEAGKIEDRETLQDSIWKFNIPASEAGKVIAYLDRFNLNSYSLFGTEESLLELLAFRELRD
jgi:hypothetical protein